MKRRAPEALESCESTTPVQVFETPVAPDAPARGNDAPATASDDAPAASEVMLVPSNVAPVNNDVPDPAETLEEREAREMQESIELARMLMAEEAEASFALQYEVMQSASEHMEGADFVAVQQLLRADEEAAQAMRGGADDQEGSEEYSDEDEETEDGERSGAQPTYDELIELGRHIGDVKAERWAFK